MSTYDSHNNNNTMFISNMQVRTLPEKEERKVVNFLILSKNNSAYF